MNSFLPSFSLNLVGKIFQAMLKPQNLILLIVAIGVVLALDTYLFKAISPRINNIQTGWLRKTYRILFWASTVVMFGSFLMIFLYFSIRFVTSVTLMNVTMALFILMVVPRIFLLAIFLLEDGARLIEGAVRYFSGNPVQGAESLPAETAESGYFPDRRKFIGQLALGAAAVPFAGILYGVTKGKYNFTVRRLTLSSPDVPKNFDGFQLLQISDLHTGSFDSARNVQYGVDMIKDQGADLITFTGDMVNNVATEVEPWMKVFDQLEAKDGVLSTLGNHDYGDYVAWPDAAAKKANLDLLKQHHNSMGYDLLLNEHRVIERNGESIVVGGVENWGKPPFPQHGDLSKAFEGTDDQAFRILMSHDPSHWDGQVLDHDLPVNLTLSGHTHGMQFGIEIPGFRWSPVKYRYPRWAGAYEEEGKFLYVNRGFGYLAFPGRVGIWPEITVITLKHGPAGMVEA